MRGRLIKPLLVEFRIVDKVATAPQLDDVFRAPKIERPFGARGERRSGVKYQENAVRLRAQVEVTNIAAQNVGPAGNVPDYRTAFVLHFRDLEAQSLVDAATGKPLLQPGTRVEAIYALDGALQRRFSDPPCHVVEARELGFGLGGKRNLLMLVTDDRPQGLEKAP